jgi:hypothetical protein
VAPLPRSPGRWRYLPAHYGSDAYLRERPTALISGVPPKIRTSAPYSNASGATTRSAELDRGGKAVELDARPGVLVGTVGAEACDVTWRSASNYGLRPGEPVVVRIAGVWSAADVEVNASF